MRKAFGGLLLSTLGTAALGASSKAYIYDGEAAPYSKDLACYSCIQNDYIFCQQSTDHPLVASGAANPAGYCCSDYDNCPYVDNASWNCSSTYNDKLLSLRMCPFRKDRCGSSSDIIFSSTGAHQNTSITLYPGDVCFYTVHAECGLPSFEPAGSGSNSVDIFTIEYDDQDVQTSNETAAGAEIPIPDKTVPLTMDQINNDYYSYTNQFYFSYLNGSYISCWMEDSGVFTCKFDNRIEYYSAYGAYDQEYTESKYLNPWYGYHYNVTLNADNSSFVVVFTNGVNTIYPVANTTAWSYADGSTVVVDNASGHRTYYPPNYYYQYQDGGNNGSNGSNSTNASSFAVPSPINPPNDWYYQNNSIQNITTWSDKNCDYILAKTLDQSAAPSLTEACNNGSLLVFPPVWTNYSYSYVDYNGSYNWFTQSYPVVDYFDFENSTTIYIEYYNNNSYTTYYTDGTTYYFDSNWYYNNGSDNNNDTNYNGTYEWSDDFCNYTQDSYSSATTARCLNGSTLFMPPYYWASWDAGPIVYDPIYSNGTNSTSNDTGNSTQSNFSNVISYELFPNGSYATTYDNSSVVGHDAAPAAVNDTNITWQIEGDNTFGYYTDLYSPLYWDDANYQYSGPGLFWNANTSTWDEGTWMTWSVNYSNGTWVDDNGTYYDNNGTYYGNDTNGGVASDNGTIYGPNGDNSTNGTTPDYNSSYNYVDKSGPRQGTYDQSQGGLRKYKEDSQSTNAAGQKSDPFEPICKGRNQMIIIGDPRVNASIYPARRILTVNTTTADPLTLSVLMETVGFVSDGIVSNAYSLFTCFGALFVAFVGLSLF